ncbi:hypothetical protein GCM10010532_003020 [Dactylosporangium siamense]|uniref:Uncharacterized protein n=1 Tax=Dactylosporangium siamense TaxID=685454 RepID=A0A919PLG2_9ACTN|nr:hypothetical protein Dsi01nite_022640 [Dactylosporangium siamense]
MIEELLGWPASDFDHSGMAGEVPIGDAGAARSGAGDCKWRLQMQCEAGIWGEDAVAWPAWRGVRWPGRHGA